MTPFLRIVAAIFLLVWVGAVVVCSAQPLLEHPKADAAHHHDSSADHHDGEEAPKDCHDDNPFCDSLAKTVTPVSQPALVKPYLPVLYVFDISPGLLSSASHNAPILGARPPPDPLFILTPEVFLGAAFRSLAPPSLA